MNRKLKLFFTLSVLLNILMIGTMAGFLMKCNYRPGPDFRDMAKLSAEGKALMDATFTKSHDEMGDVFNDARAARADVIDILTADTFDKPAFDKASAKLRKIQTRIMQRRVDTAAELSEKLKPEDRKLLAEWLAGPGGRPGSKYFPGHDKDGKHGPDNAPGKDAAPDARQTPGDR